MANLYFSHGFATSHFTFQCAALISHGCFHPIIPFDFYYSHFLCIIPENLILFGACLWQIEKYIIVIIISNYVLSVSIMQLSACEQRTDSD